MNKSPDDDKTQNPARRKNLTASLQSLYRGHQDNYPEEPFVSPVLKLALDIGQMLEAETITTADLTEAVSQLTLEGLKERAGRLAHWLGSCDEEENRTLLQNLFRDLAFTTGGLIPFEDYQAKVAHLFYGFVFTAHPTFSMPQELSCALVRYAAHQAGAESQATEKELADALSHPYHAPNISEEAAFSLEAIDNLHDGLAEMMTALFTVAQTLYPDNWTALRPRLCSIATWVAFDMDGRKDITWAMTLEKRIELQIRQLQSYRAAFAELTERAPEETKALKPALTQIEETLSLMRGHHRFFAAYDQKDDPHLEALQAESRALIKTAPKRLLDSKPLIEAVETLLAQTDDPALQTALMILRTQLESFGLSRAEVHFRINATQIHNAISTHIPLRTHPDHPSRRRTYIDELAALLETVEPVNIHFGDIANEDMTARYEFMLLQQITEYIDRQSPIRFLIAETESAFTILGALYYAKRFGVEDHIDICPLFETGRALQDSSRYMQVALKNETFLNYLKKRGRLCVQTGYSDAGRYIGQPAAGASIERLKERFSTLFDDFDLTGIALLFFDTHGESVGRGGHPQSFTKRLEYVASPYFLGQLEQKNISYTQESSYQGGDGFLPFLTPATTLAVITRTLTYFLQDHQDSLDDPYYNEPFRSEVTKLLTVATTFQTGLINDPRYAALLGAFATHMMPPSGSRAVKRTGISDNTLEQPQIRQFRAIPHNAILGQYGLLANTISGMGRALREHLDFADDLCRESERFQTIIQLVDRAFTLSDPQVMKAYITLLDPTFWITMAGQCDDVTGSNKRAALATHLENHGYHDGMMAVFRKLDWDYNLLSRFQTTETEQDIAAPNKTKVNMACLHAIRLVLLRQIFLLAADIPRFSPRHPVDRETLLRIIFHMDIDRAAALLDDIFPARETQPEKVDFGEPSGYEAKEGQIGYSAIRAGLIEPLRHHHALNQKISTALAHYMGFFG